MTLLTVQNTQTVAAVEILNPNFVAAQLDAVGNDIPPLAAKTEGWETRQLLRQSRIGLRRFRSL